MKDIVFEQDAFAAREAAQEYRCAQRRAGYAGWPKRALDLCLIGLALPFVAPVMLALWFLARSDGGPALFVQKRVGRSGRKFRCYKFRTMVVDADRVLARLFEEDADRAAEWKHHQKLRDDPRVTKAGRFLRATSLDELPQLLNVLKGDMSLVGPRPFMLRQEKIYCAAGGRGYYAVRPGITGPWQVEGRSRTSFTARVHFDEAYAQAPSLRRDLSLLTRTVAVVVRRTGT